MKKEKVKKIKQAIRKKYGWPLCEWAERNGFSRYMVYDTLRGKAGKKTTLKIIKTLRNSNII